MKLDETVKQDEVQMQRTQPGLRGVCRDTAPADVDYNVNSFGEFPEPADLDF